MRKSLLAVCLVLPAVALGIGSAKAQGASGDLRCTVAGGLGAIVAAQRALTCVYYRPDGVTEFYTGSSSRLGLDLGATNAVRLAFHVAGADPNAPAALDGGFGGPGVGVTIGSGIGASALIGGRTGAVALLPIANTSLTGIDISAGLSVLTLHYAGMETLRDRRRNRF